MNSKTILGISSVCFIGIVVLLGAISFDEPVSDDMYPGREVLDTNMNENIDEFAVHISYHNRTLYEHMEFGVNVHDRVTALPIENATVTFMDSNIVAVTPNDGIVYFTTPYISRRSAPHIRKEYITTPNNTTAIFPLQVAKDNYKTYRKNLSVHSIDS